MAIITDRPKCRLGPKVQFGEQDLLRTCKLFRYFN